MIKRLTERVQERDAAPADLPEQVDLHDEALAWRVWGWLEAVDWKWPPDVLLRQPEALMEDISVLAHLSRQVERLLKDR